MNSDSGICTASIESIKCQVVSFKVFIKVYRSQVFGELVCWRPQNKTVGRIGMFSLCSFGSPYSLGGCGTGRLSQ